MCFRIIFFLFILIYSNSLFCKDPQTGIEIYQESNRKFEQDAANLARINDPLLDYNAIVKGLPEITKVCENLNWVKRCSDNDKDKIALILYDPYIMLDKDSNDKDARRPPDSFCYALNEFFKYTGYCVEKIALETPESLTEILNQYDGAITNKNMYIVNLTHGYIGTWNTTYSVCSSKVKKECPFMLDNSESKASHEAIKDCVSAMKRNISSCPCYNFLDTLGQKKKYMDHVIENQPKLIEEANHYISLAEQELLTCKNSEENKENYSTAFSPASVASLAAKGATILSFSCSTGLNYGFTEVNKDTKDEPISAFKNEICSNAPEGVTFNMSDYPVNSSLKVLPLYKREIVRSYLERKRNNNNTDPTYDEDKLAIEAKKLLAKKTYWEPYIYGETIGNFTCWKCLKDETGNKTAREIDCKDFKFPAYVRDIKVKE